MNWPKKPSTIAEMEAINATGPERNVLNVTPKPVTSSICNQMLR